MSLQCVRDLSSTEYEDFHEKNLDFRTQFDIVHVPYTISGHNITVCGFTIKLERKFKSHLQESIIPSGLLVALSWVVKKLVVPREKKEYTNFVLSGQLFDPSRGSSGSLRPSGHSVSMHCEHSEHCDHKYSKSRQWNISHSSMDISLPCLYFDGDI